MNPGTSRAGERWRQQIDRQKISGLSIAAFCRRHSIAVATFYFWKRRLSEPEQGSAFVEVRPPPVNDAASSGQTHRSIELCLRGGRRLRLRRGFDRQVLLDLLGVLEGKP
jgi:transposase-like protein